MPLTFTLNPMFFEVAWALCISLLQKKLITFYRKILKVCYCILEDMGVLYDSLCVYINNNN